MRKLTQVQTYAENILEHLESDESFTQDLQKLRKRAPSDEWRALFTHLGKGADRQAVKLSMMKFIEWCEHYSSLHNT